MKTIRINLAFTMGLLITSAALLASGADLPFHGTMLGNESSTLSPPHISAEGSGKGTATHLGQFQVTWESASDNLVGHASYEFTAANGDKLTARTEGDGQADISQYPMVIVSETDTITGGTGRFQGASGTFTLTTVIIVLSGTSVTQDSVSSWFDGNIVYPQSRRVVAGAGHPAGFRLRFAGVPAHQYTIQRAPSVGGDWGDLTPIIAPVDGLIDFVDTQRPPSEAFYRAAQ